MKRILVLLFLITTFGIKGIYTENPSEIKSFEVSDYQYYIDNFPSDEILGSVRDAEDAKKKAEELWIELYGRDIKKERPYKVYYDAKNEVWMVEGTLPFYYGDGGVAYILMEKETGKVLAVWHDK